MAVWTKTEFHHWSDIRYRSDELQIKGIVQLCLLTFFHDSCTEPACCTSKYGTASSRLAFSGSLSGSLQEVKDMFIRWFRAHFLMQWIFQILCRSESSDREILYSNIWTKLQTIHVLWFLFWNVNWPATHTIGWHESDVNGLLQLTQSANKQASFSESFEY